MRLSLGRLCHADVLAGMFREPKGRQLADRNCLLPSDDSAKLAALAQRQAWKLSRMSAKNQSRQDPTARHGHGEPLRVGHGDQRRLLMDGAGLCSPGLWPPEQRFPATGVAKLMHDAFRFELDVLGKALDGGLPKLLADLASGRLSEDPFPGLGYPASP